MLQCHLMHRRLWLRRMATSEAFGVGLEIIKWVKLLYKHPEAAVQTVLSLQVSYKAGEHVFSTGALSCGAMRKYQLSCQFINSCSMQIILFFVTHPDNYIPALHRTINTFFNTIQWKGQLVNVRGFTLTSYCPGLLFLACAFWKGHFKFRNYFSPPA